MLDARGGERIKRKEKKNKKEKQNKRKKEIMLAKGACRPKRRTNICHGATMCPARFAVG